MPPGRHHEQPGGIFFLGGSRGAYFFWRGYFSEFGYVAMNRAGCCVAYNQQSLANTKRSMPRATPSSSFDAVTKSASARTSGAALAMATPMPA